MSTDEHPFRKHLCLLFISMAAISTYVTIIEKNSPLKNRNSSNFTGFYNNSSGNLSELDALVASFLQSDNNSGTVSAPIIKKEEMMKDARIKLNLTSVSPGNGRRTLYILGLFELTRNGDKSPQGVSEMLAAKLAVQHVNEINVLPAYRLQLIVNDTRCDIGTGIDRFFHAMYSNNTILSLLGTSLSNVTETLAHIVPYWNVLQVSFGSTSPSLSDRDKFPLFFRTIAPDSSHNFAKINFVKHFGWKVVAAFSQSENRFLLPLNNLVTQLENANVSCIATITFSEDDYKEQLKALKALDTRIIIGSFSAEMAQKIFCEVYELKMFGSEYVWVLQDQRHVWWDGKMRACSIDRIRRATDGLILVADHDVVSDGETSISGMSNEDFQSCLNFSKKEVSKYAKQSYDAVWTIALALRETGRIIGNELSDFNYGRADITCQLVAKINRLNFMGLSGPVQFYGSDRIGTSIFRQIQGQNIFDVAIFHPTEDELNFSCRTCKPIKWRQNRVPLAQRKLKTFVKRIPRSLVYIISSVCAVGIVVSVIFLHFNLRFRRVKMVKLSSPKLSNIAVIGCILVYVSVIFLSLDTEMLEAWKIFTNLCMIRVYLLSAGFSLAFGSMFAKTYRVHRLFTYSSTTLVRDKLLKDKQLIVLVFVPLCIDALILSLWIMTDPMRPQLYNLTLEISLMDREIVYQPQVEVCRSQNTFGWFTAMYGYKAIILIMGVYMAWETRHVKIPPLNDSQYIGISSYSAVFCAIITTISNLMTKYLILSYLATSVSILVAVTVILFLLFWPKLKTVFNESENEDLLTQCMGLRIEYKTRRLVIPDRQDMINRLEIQNRVYRYRLESLDEEIEKLEGLLALGRGGPSVCGEVFSISRSMDQGDERVLKAAYGRASWPNDNRVAVDAIQTSSDNKLYGKELEKLNIFGKLKRFLGTLQFESDEEINLPGSNLDSKIGEKKDEQEDD